MNSCSSMDLCGHGRLHSVEITSSCNWTTLAAGRMQAFDCSRDYTNLVCDEERRVRKAKLNVPFSLPWRSAAGRWSMG